MSAFLDAFRTPRVWLMIALGFGSGLPISLTDSTLKAWMTDAKIDVKAIGLLTLVGLPYSLKILWAPVFDRYQLPWLGRRRGWMAVTQIALAVGLLAMGAGDPAAAPLRLAMLGVAVATLSATQDIVSDAYRTDLLPTNERASGTATYVVGYRAALIVAGALALYLADRIPWRTVYWLMAALVSVGLVATLVAPEPERVRPPRTLAEAVVEPFFDYFSRRQAALVLLFVALYKAGDMFANAVMMPFLLESMHFTKSDVATLQKFLGLAATIAGVMVGGGLVAKLGVRRSLLWFGAAQAVTNAGYLAMAYYGPSRVFLGVAIAVDQVCGGLGTVAFTAFLMSLCNKRFSAFQYALLASASSAIGRLVGAWSGFAAAALGWPLFFATTIAAAAPALLLLLLLPADAAAPPPEAPTAAVPPQAPTPA